MIHVEDHAAHCRMAREIIIIYICMRLHITTRPVEKILGNGKGCLVRCNCRAIVMLSTRLLGSFLSESFFFLHNFDIFFAQFFNLLFIFSCFFSKYVKFNELDFFASSGEFQE